MGDRRDYDCVKANAITRYVAKMYPDLSMSAYALYLTLPVFEADKFGYCKTVCIGVRDIARLAHMSVKTVKGALMELRRAGLMHVRIGVPSKRGDATTLRRVPIEELKSQTITGETVHKQFARALVAKGVWLDGGRVYPQWEVRKTNRLYASKPNVQGLSKQTRMDQLISGAPEGSVLVSCDIASADPTVIKALLKLPQDFDPYALAMQSTGWDRPTAKAKTNELAYCSDTRYKFSTWPGSAQQDGAIRDYAEKLVSFKARLQDDARSARAVRTLAGTTIALPKRSRPHVGRMLNWVVQGTVADVIATAGLCLIQRADVSSMVCLHDELIVLFEPSCKSSETLCAEVEHAIQRSGQEMGLPLRTASRVRIQEQFR